MKSALLTSRSMVDCTAQDSIAPRGAAGRVSSFSLAPAASGLVMVLRRQRADGSLQQEAWPLRGGLWDKGAADLPEVFPLVVDVSTLDAGIAVAERLRAGGASEPELRTLLDAQFGIDSASDFDCVMRQALELLGASDRQIEIYARENFLGLSAQSPTMQCVDLLSASLKARAAIDLALERGAAQPQLQLQPIDLDASLDKSYTLLLAGIRRAMDQRLREAAASGRRLDLPPDAAQANARNAINQLGIFTGPENDQIRSNSVSGEDLDVGAQALADQVALAPTAVSDATLVEQVARCLIHPPAAEPGGSSGLGKRRRERSLLVHQPPPEAQRIRGDQAQAQARAVQPDLAGGWRNAPWIEALAKRLDSVCRPPEPAGLNDRLAQLKQAGIAVGLFKPDRWREVESILFRQPFASGTIERLELLRKAALGRLNTQLADDRALADVRSLAIIARAELIPVPTGVSPVPRDRLCMLLKTPDADSFLLPYPLERFASLGHCAAEVAEQMRDLLHYLLNAHIAMVTGLHTPLSERSLFGLLSMNLLQLMASVRHPPAPPMGLPRFMSHSRQPAEFSRMLVEAFSQVLAERVLDIPEPGPASPHDADWRVIVRGAIRKLPDPAILHRALLGQDVSARIQLVHATQEAFLDWFYTALPDVNLPRGQHLIASLVDLANRHKIRRAPYSVSEVLDRIALNFWDFIHQSHQGIRLSDGQLVPFQDHPVAFIQKALLKKADPSSGEFSADALFDHYRLAIRHADAEQILEVLKMVHARARDDGRQFVTEFLRDIGDFHD